MNDDTKAAQRPDEELDLSDFGNLTPIFSIGYPLRSRDVNMLGWRTRHPIPKAGSTTRAP